MVFHEIAAFFEDGTPIEWGEAGDDDSEGFASGVSVNCGYFAAGRGGLPGEVCGEDAW
jgi:hypothetical protein